MRTLARIASAAVVLAALGLAACGGRRAPAPVAVEPLPIKPLYDVAHLPRGLDVRLSDRTRPGAESSATPDPSGENELSDAAPNPAVDRPHLAFADSPTSSDAHLLLDVYYDDDGDQVIASAIDGTTGAPLAGVTLAYGSGAPVAMTDAAGLARLPRPIASDPRLVASRDGDHVEVVLHDVERDSARALAWFVVDGRQLYRPGETVSLAGWVRTRGRDIESIDSKLATVRYRVLDNDQKEIAHGTAKLGRLGSFSTTFPLPAKLAIGDAEVEFSAGGATYDHYFEIEDPRRPTMELAVHTGDGPFVVGDAGTDVTVNANDGSGAPSADAKVEWLAAPHPTRFAPPNWREFKFGARYLDEHPSGRRLPREWHLDGTTDANGAHVIHVAFPTVDPPVPTELLVYATVTAATSPEATGAGRSRVLLVHPSAAYVGLALDRAFAAPGAPIDVRVIGVGIDGRPLPGAKITVRATRVDGNLENGTYREREVEPQTCDVVATDTPQRCRFTTTIGGEYRVTATITDARGRPNRTQISYWAIGGGGDPRNAEVTLIPDRSEYAVGQTAHVLAISPFDPALGPVTGIVTWRRDGIVRFERVTFSQRSMVLDVPITDALVPNVEVVVDLFGHRAAAVATSASGPRPVKRIGGGTTLAISMQPRALDVSVTPASPTAAPGSTVELAVRVADASGKPTPDADVVVFAVDDAALAYDDYVPSNPLDAFYAQRPPGVSHVWPGQGWHGQRIDWWEPPEFTIDPVIVAIGNSRDYRPYDRDRMTLTDAFALYGHFALDDGAREFGQGPRVPRGGQLLRPHFDFDPLVAFAPNLTTDANGTARVTVKLPARRARVRLVAIAAAGATQFGRGEGTLNCEP